MKCLFALFLLLLTLSACSPPIDPETTILPTGVPTATAMPSSTLLPTAAAGATPQDCGLLPVNVPTLPAVIPPANELDETTGLHVTGKAQEIDVQSYRLVISGKVKFPLKLTYDTLRCMPKVTVTPTLICVGVFEDVATWSGVPLKYVLELAGIQEDATRINLVSADGYKVGLLVEEVLNKPVFLAYEWEGQPLPILHGFPVRLVAPGMYGSNWVKWLVEIIVE